MTKIGRHTATFCNETIIISTVELFGEYETMVLFEDGEELECVRSSTLEEAKKNHNLIVNKWNDKIWEGSTARLLGVPNYGQFVKTVIAC